MEEIREDLKWISRAIAIICIVWLLIAYPIVGSIIAVVAVVVILGYILFSPNKTSKSNTSNNSNTLCSKNNNDDEFPSVGGVNIDLHPCEANPYYTSKEEIEKKLNLKIPDYFIKECKESPKTPYGYLGEATIEFKCIVDEKLLHDIMYELNRQQKRCRKWMPGEHFIPIVRRSPDLNGEYWAIIIKENSSQAIIKYRSPRPELVKSSK